MEAMSERASGAGHRWTPSEDAAIPADQVPALIVDAIDHAVEGVISVPPMLDPPKRRAALRGWRGTLPRGGPEPAVSDWGHSPRHRRRDWRDGCDAWRCAVLSGKRATGSKTGRD